MKIHRFRCEQWLGRPLEEVFAFFADAFNLERLTPPWLRFRVLTPAPIEMREGALIDYRLRLHGLPLRWRSRIALWEPPHRFADEQVRGPYRRWHHTHRFEPGGEGTTVIDEVDYAVWGGSLVDRLLVRGDVERIFAYRRATLERELAAPGLNIRPGSIILER